MTAFIGLLILGTAACAPYRHRHVDSAGNLTSTTVPGRGYDRYAYDRYYDPYRGQSYYRSDYDRYDYDYYRGYDRYAYHQRRKTYHRPSRYDDNPYRNIDFDHGSWCWEDDRWVWVD
jgi:hypothetical protein